MSRDVKLIVSESSHYKPIIVHVKNTKKMKKCMEILGFSYDEKKSFKENAKEFIRYLISKKTLDLCEIYKSKDIVDVAGKLTSRDRYLLTFVKFTEIKMPKLHKSTRISFKAHDYYPTDYQYNKDVIAPKWPTKTKKKELPNGKIIKIIIRRGVVYSDEMKNGIKSDVNVKIVGSVDSKKTKGKYQKLFAVDEPLMKYLKYYLYKVIMSNTLEGRFVRALYGSTGVLK